MFSVFQGKHTHHLVPTPLQLFLAEQLDLRLLVFCVHRFPFV